MVYETDFLQFFSHIMVECFFQVEKWLIFGFKREHWASTTFPCPWRSKSSKNTFYCNLVAQDKTRYLNRNQECEPSKIGYGLDEFSHLLYHHTFLVFALYNRFSYIQFCTTVIFVLLKFGIPQFFHSSVGIHRYREPKAFLVHLSRMNTHPWLTRVLIQLGLKLARWPLQKVHKFIVSIILANFPLFLVI